MSLFAQLKAVKFSKMMIPLSDSFIFMLNFFFNKSRSAIILITKTQKEDVSNMEFMEFSSY